ncbi:MAG: cupin domain-containing protein [Ferruginibacter sp.]
MPNLKDVIPKTLLPGIIGYYAHGAQASMGLVELSGGTIMPIHQHIHEQITYIIEGHLDMVINDKPYSLFAGNYFVIPSNVWHGAKAITDCKLIDVFSPVREEYK